ncbi:MAG: hypothetical protein AB1521_02720 [Bacteroidota bacterium]
MFEREIKFIYDFNLNKVNRLGPYFTFDQLLAIDIHPAIMHYISAEIDYLVFEDRQKLLKNSVFDYSGEKITQHFNQISEEVKRSKRFSLEYISKLILHSSSFTINYLSRPKWTLLKFVFDDSDHKATTEIKQILNYVYYYQYLKKILISYINSKKILSMNVSEFEELLNKVDNLGIETYLPSILTNTLKSISEFFNIGELQKNKIPLAALELFLEEKKLNRHLHKVESIYGDDKNQKINVADLQKVFDSIMIEKSEIFVEPVSETEEYKEPIEPVKPAVTEEPLSADNEHESTTEEMHQEVEPSYDEEDKLISGKLRIRIDKENKIEPVEEEIKESEKIYPETVSEEHTGADEQLSEEETEVYDEERVTEVDEVIEENVVLADTEENIVSEEIQKEESPEQDDNESMLDVILKSKQPEEVEKINDEEQKVKTENKNVVFEKEENVKVELTELLEHKDMTKIIEVIFDYDIEEFANVIDEISNCKFLDDAFVVLNQTFRNHNINRNSKEAAAFREIISEYFERK